MTRMSNFYYLSCCVSGYLPTYVKFFDILIKYPLIGLLVGRVVGIFIKLLIKLKSIK